MTVRLITGSCMDVLPTLEADSVQLCLTSPPYFALRSYLPAGHPDKDKEIGSEPTPDAFVATMVAVFREVKRVLRDDGILCINLGDSYAGSGKGPTGHNGIQNAETRQGFESGYLRENGEWSRGGRKSKTEGIGGIPAKNLLMLPFRVAIALQQDGWYLRSVIPWVKRNPMPESVRDRPATAIEYLFLLSKSRTYYWDAESVRQPHQDAAGGPERFGCIGVNGGYRTEKPQPGVRRDSACHPTGAREYNPAGRSYRNSDAFFQSWRGLMLDEDGDPLALVVNPQSFSGSHFATFPTGLVEPFVKAGTRKGDTVLDPFGGAGTVGLVADRLGRDAVLIELNESYVRMARDRIDADAGSLFAEPVQVTAVQTEMFAAAPSPMAGGSGTGGRGL